MFAPAAEQKIVISDVIADETGSKGGGVGATGKGSLTVNGPGTLDLTASNNTFSGGVTIDQGTLEIGTSSAVQSNINFAAMGGGTLLIDASIGSSGLGTIFTDVNSLRFLGQFGFRRF